MSDQFSSQWQRFRQTTDLDEYDTRWDRLAAEGKDVHGEADFTMAFSPTSVLDAGCGMGRVGIELDKRGVEVVGADLDDDLLDRARRRAPHIAWHQANLATLDLGGTFDLVLMAGNILPFAQPDQRADILRAMANHLEPKGHLVMGVHLTADWPTAGEYEQLRDEAGLTLVDRFGGWGREPWPAEGSPDYQVTVYQLIQP